LFGDSCFDVMIRFAGRRALGGAGGRWTALRSATLNQRRGLSQGRTIFTALGRSSVSGSSEGRRRFSPYISGTVAGFVFGTVGLHCCLSFLDQSSVTYCEAEKEPVGSDEEWNRLHDMLEDVRKSTNSTFEATTVRSEDSALVRFKVQHHVDLFELLVCVLSSLDEKELRAVNLDGGEMAQNLSIHADDGLSSSSVRVWADNVHISLFQPQVGPFHAELTFERFNEFFTPQEMEGIVEAYQLSQLGQNTSGADGYGLSTRKPERSGEGPKSAQEFAKVERELAEFGASVHQTDHKLQWSDLAGYDEIKRLIDDTLIYALTYPEVYDRITKGTRERFQTSRPRAVLFEGPPGCGKTTSAKILASQAGVPFVHIPVEGVMSRWYGESERNLSKMLSTTSEMGPALVFVDEVDALGTSRDKEIHEASRKMLSVLLRHIDGMDGQQSSILVAATNRKSDLDAALLSRFDIVIRFDLPDESTRRAMFALYAKQLDEEELSMLAGRSENLSGRDVLDICKEAERACAGRCIRENRTDALDLPVATDYLQALEQFSKSAEYA